MSTVTEKNIFLCEIDGTFDDCQRIVKEILKDYKFSVQNKISAVNSINWARIIIQSVYYFYTYIKFNNNIDNKVNFSVPTGNFGDIYAGYVAYKMGLPVNRLIIATNENDILDRFMKSGIYKTDTVVKTTSPSMDIQIASNFERLLYEVFDKSEKLIDRIYKIFSAEGANSWFEENAKERFLEGIIENHDDWEKVDDILDVWFESGTTHAFVLENNPETTWPADMYLEGSDQHRGWFHSSLLESSLTRGRAPYKSVLTHGFTMDKDGRKMSKSLGNVVSPQDIVKKYGADILRLWVASTDYSDDQRIGEEILKSIIESYRKIRNTIRWMLGVLSNYDQSCNFDYEDLNELEKYMLHGLTRLQEDVQDAYEAYDYRRVTTLLMNYINLELSAFYFDIRKAVSYTHLRAHETPEHRGWRLRG